MSRHLAADTWAATDHPSALGPWSTHLSQRKLSDTIKVFRPAANRAGVEKKALSVLDDRRPDVACTHVVSHFPRPG